MAEKKKVTFYLGTGRRKSAVARVRVTEGKGQVLINERPLVEYFSEEKDRAQGALNFFVFATLAVSSLASGVLVTTTGWAWLNYGSTAPLAVISLALMWLAVNRHQPRPV